MRRDGSFNTGNDVYEGILMRGIYYEIAKLKYLEPWIPTNNIKLRQNIKPKVFTEII